MSTSAINDRLCGRACERACGRGHGRGQGCRVLGMEQRKAGVSVCVIGL